MSARDENYLKKAIEPKKKNGNYAKCIMKNTNCSKLYTKKQYL